ncbi:hypothetical protein BUALT_Bualt16G0044400 [Buddleja alternifolia]|uniref:Cytochrome P450 n=1 Tax=Buddleja alternifolia TaxID=168488 RepID=A0AAV6WFM2_9LAMI|nr:hypothetical protein BUALT_Bualt16G0044400 [Buddleja alternifolia]
MNKQGHIQKPTLNPLITILTKGLTTLQGDEWATHRRIINPAFHLEKLKGMIPVFVNSSAVLIEKWKKTIAPGGTLEVDIWPEFQELTGDMISRTAFGSSYEEGNEILKFQKELQNLVMETMQSLYIPGLRITSMLRALIEGKEEMMKKREANEDNLLSLLSQSNNENNPQVTTSQTSKYHMTMDEIIEECKQFYLAGHETTSSWDNDPDAEVISHLKIVNMILHEVLRLYPPVIALYQHAHKESKIGNLNIQAGVDLVLPILLVNRDPELWGDDAEYFKPKRFF